MDGMLTVREVAARLHIHPNTVKRLLHDGDLSPAYQVNGRGDWRIPESTIQAWLDRHAAVPA